MRNKRLAMIAAICVLAVGFAAVSTVLYINGTTNVKTDPDDFTDNVIFTDSSTLEVTDTEKGGTSSISSDGKTITFATGELTSLNNTSTLKFDVTNNSTQYDASAKISCTSVDSNYSEYVDVVTTPASDPNTFTIDAGDTISGSVVITLKKSALGDDGNGITVPFTCTINANAVERTSAYKKARSTVAGNYDGTTFTSWSDLVSNGSVVVDGTTLTYLGSLSGTVIVDDSVTEVGNGNVSIGQDKRMLEAVIVLKEGVTTIKYEALYSFTLLTDLYLPKSLTTLESKIIYGSIQEDLDEYGREGTFTIHYAGTEEEWNTLLTNNASTNLALYPVEYNSVYE